MATIEKYLLEEIAAIKDVDAFAKDFIRTELDADELRTARVRSTINHNSNRQLLQHFNLYDMAKKAIEIRTQKAAYRQIEIWQQQTDDFNAPSCLFFDEGTLVKRWDDDVYGLTAEILRSDPELKQKTADLFLKNLKSVALSEELSEKEIRKATSQSKEYKYAELDFSSNTIACFKKTFEHFSLTEEVQKAYQIRYEKALRLNPYNSEEKIKEFMWFFFKPEEYKNSERLKSRIETTSNVYGFKVEQIKAVDRVFYQHTVLKTESHGGGHSVEQILCKTVDNTEFTAYEVMAWWAGGDDAGEWSEIYNKLPPAVARYHEINRETPEYVNAILSAATDNFAVFEKHNCWETGIDHYELRVRVPENIFKALGLTYHDEEIEEEGDWKGWYTTDRDATRAKLESLNWTSNL